MPSRCHYISMMDSYSYFCLYRNRRNRRNRLFQSRQWHRINGMEIFAHANAANDPYRAIEGHLAEIDYYLTKKKHLCENWAEHIWINQIKWSEIEEEKIPDELVSDRQTARKKKHNQLIWLPVQERKQLPHLLPICIASVIDSARRRITVLINTIFLSLITSFWRLQNTYMDYCAFTTGFDAAIIQNNASNARCAQLRVHFSRLINFNFNEQKQLSRSRGAYFKTKYSF